MKNAFPNVGWDYTIPFITTYCIVRIYVSKVFAFILNLYFVKKGIFTWKFFIFYLGYFWFQVNNKEKKEYSFAFSRYDILCVSKYNLVRKNFNVLMWKANGIWYAKTFTGLFERNIFIDLYNIRLIVNIYCFLLSI